jgi:hypothetical protein
MCFLHADHAMSQTKYAYCNFVYTRDDYSLTVDAELIDFHYTYAAKLSKTWHRHLADFTVYEMISRSGLAINGYLFQVCKILENLLFNYWFNNIYMYQYFLLIIVNLNNKIHKHYPMLMFECAVFFHSSCFRTYHIHQINCPYLYNIIHF